ncbi:MAG: carboxypeptidase-like regulatory domain-containing protein, partial [Pseudomonadota bacterium]
MTVRTWILRALALSLLALSLPAWAIEGGLAIDVIDAETRRPLAGVTLRVESRDGVNSSLVTDETGSARFEALENGFYELRATAEGRQPVVEPEVRVIEDQIRPLRIELVATNAAIDELVVTGRAR